MHGLPEPLRIEYELTESDVWHYCSGGLGRRWCRLFWLRKGSLVLLGALLSFLFGICFHARGLRAGGLAIGTTLIVLMVLLAIREAWMARQICRVARQWGLPCSLRLEVSREGITRMTEPEAMEPTHTFPWSEVVGLAYFDHLIVIRLRPSGGVLIVPDSAFPSPERRCVFEAALRAFRASAA